MIGRLVHSADFQRLLASPSWSRSAHFAVHHLPVRPSVAKKLASKAAESELSTGELNNLPPSVDKSPDDHWLGAVLPKRLARRAVTRNLLRRQIRAAIDRHRATLPPGLWVVRLRSTFARTEFLSAASEPLRQAARAELDRALQPRAR